MYVDVDDLVQAGVLGLIDAENKFDSKKHVAFSSYAKHRIKGAMLDSLRKLDWATRDMRRHQKHVEAATRALAATLQRDPTETEVAEKLGVSIDRWRRMMLDIPTVSPMSLSTRADENDDLPPPDFPDVPASQPDSICAYEQLRSILAEAIKALPERYQQVIVFYHTNEMSMKEIGSVLGINESRVSQINKTALQKMAVALHYNGIDSLRAF
jgi:RNA polymerase sigma factor for flagellar operon FliA